MSEQEYDWKECFTLGRVLQEWGEGSAYNFIYEPYGDTWAAELPDSKFETCE